MTADEKIVPSMRLMKSKHLVFWKSKLRVSNFMKLFIIYFVVTQSPPVEEFGISTDFICPFNEISPCDLLQIVLSDIWIILCGLKRCSIANVQQYVFPIGYAPSTWKKTDIPACYFRNTEVDFFVNIKKYNESINDYNFYLILAIQGGRRWRKRNPCNFSGIRGLHFACFFLTRTLKTVPYGEWIEYNHILS